MVCRDVYAWARDNYAINHFSLFLYFHLGRLHRETFGVLLFFSYLLSLAFSFQIFSFQSTWAVSRETTRFSRRISYKRCIGDSWFSIDLPQCVLTDNTTGTLMYVEKIFFSSSPDTRTISISPRLALGSLFVDPIRLRDWWFQLMLDGSFLRLHLLSI